MELSEAVNLLDDVGYYLQRLNHYQTGKIGPAEFKKEFDNQAGEMMDKADKAKKIIMEAGNDE